MRSATIIAAALASMASAMPTVVARDTGSAIANIVAVNGFGDSATKTPVKVPFGTLTHFDLEITQLSLESITLNVPDISPPLPNVNAITCQMYRDQYGVQQGSAEFTASQSALISTNPVQFGWVLCYRNVDTASS